MKFLHNIVLASVGVCLFSSCVKQLDLVPSDVVIEDRAFRDVPSLESGLVGVYSSFNGTYDNDIYSTSLYSDEAMLPTENNTGRGVIAYRWQTDPGIDEVTAAWSAYYFAIDRANRLIAAADKLKGATSDEEVQRIRIKGEALALRAFGHLQLVINYAENYDPNSLGVAYMEKSEMTKPSRLKVGDDYAKIKADLQAAAGMIPGSYSVKGRISGNAINAIRARLALYSKSWDDAISASNAVISAVPLATKAEYPQIWKDASEAEVVWKQVRDIGEVRLGDSYYDRELSKIMYAPSNELISSFAPTDVRLASTVVSRGAGRPSVGKYIGGDVNEPGRADIKVFRTAEMYLIRAEAYAEKGTLSAATADLTTLRAARITGYTPQAYADKDAFITDLMQERFKELAFEGQRMADLRRRLLPVTRNPEDAINALGATILNPSAKTYYYPIPAAEIKANENMIQNPGYR